MIREDKQASLVTEHTLFGSKRYRFVATRARGSRRFKSDEIQPLLEQQMRSAITIFTREDGKRLWMFRDRFYWEDEGLAAEDVTALARQRELKRQRQLDRARSVARADQVPERSRRESIPREIRLAVWERDGGRCVKCGAKALLQFDHVIPVAMGGSNAVDNIELLCDRCNQEKGASLY
jgi:5-methylcytosine-specific restriction endonuclease McrA